jgi:UDP-N-acetylmuramoyl-L-alanyl-D-glutamate--2,6-diaminopimelate ligase
MRLRELLAAVGTDAVCEGGDPEISRVIADSRLVAPGDVFFALPGAHDDGRRHVADALARGASAIVADGPAAAGVAMVRTAEPRELLGKAAAYVAGDPSAALTLVGVTGTNGKTTTTYLLEAIWTAAGFHAGVVGTIAYRFAGVSRAAPLTTPDAPALQALLAEMRAAGTTHVAMEVSSHALVQDRVAGCRFDAGVFTNLTRDHLDFHRDMEDYYTAKARLFLDYLPAGGKDGAVAVVNVDDESGRRLAASLGVRCVRFGRSPEAQVRPQDVETSLAGTHGELDLGGTCVPFTTALVGAPHLENVLAAAATAWALAVPTDAIGAGLAAARPPAGRLEQIAGPGFTVVVDYAHTPDALARALDALRPLTQGRLITVFGCGGDRDRGKRPLMGQAVGRRSDVVVLTSDNPRTEDPGAIIAEIEPGVRAAGLEPLGRDAVRGYVVEPDRQAAIGWALARARPGDLVLVAGKGHEDYQIVGHEKRHLDDREEVRSALGRLA